MSSFLTIVKKEILDTVRDRRTMITMVVMPLLMFPVLFAVMNQVSKIQKDKEDSKQIRLAVVDHGQAAGLVDDLKEKGDFDLRMDLEDADHAAMIEADSLDAVLMIDAGFDAKIDALKTGKISLRYKANNDIDKTESRIMAIVDSYEERVMSSRLRGQELKSSFIRPIRVKKENLASKQEQLGQTIGGFLPYLFVIFSFMGCMYPAIDLFTGEKERGTIETILTAPVNRLTILFGKMTVISMIGIISALLAVLGLYLTVKFSGGVPQAFQTMLSNILTPKFVVALLLMLVPLNIFFAGVMVPMTIYAKSFKEAQSILTPVTFLLVVPILIGMIPTIEMSLLFAFVPILNITLASKALISDTLLPLHFIVTVGSLVGYAILSVMVCIRWFESEANVLR